MPSHQPPEPRPAPSPERAPDPARDAGAEPSPAPVHPSRPLTPRQVLHLQRTVGNRATGQILRAGAPARVQRKPSTFAVQAQDALELKAGDNLNKLRGGSVAFSIFGAKVPNFLATPWTRFREALRAYTSLPDQVTDERHQERLLGVRRTLALWKREHEVDDGEELSENEQAKLAAIAKVEAVLPDEVQYARPPAPGKPASPAKIVVSRLEFMFQEALGDSFLAVHSQAAWEHWVATLPHFGAELLEAEIPDGQAEAVRQMDDGELVALAVARAEALRQDEDANTKIAYAGYSVLPRLAVLAQRQGPPTFDDYFAPHARAALETLVDNQLRDRYPALADDLTAALQDPAIRGVELHSFLKAISESYVEPRPKAVVALGDEDLDQLRQDIRASPEYADLVATAQAAGSGNVAENLPGDQEALEGRRNTLLADLQFEMQVERQGGVLEASAEAVPQASKERVVDAVMIFEALAGQRFPRLPRFVLVRKQSGGTYRANADSESQYIRYDVDFEMRTGVHELGHFYENQVPLDQWYTIYTLLRSRHDTESAQREKPADKSYGFSFQPAEHGFMGGLKGLRMPELSEYSARYYATGHTEMMSLFSEHLIRPAELERVIDTDPQGFAVLLRVLRPGALSEWSDAELGFA